METQYETYPVIDELTADPDLEVMDRMARQNIVAWTFGAIGWAMVIVMTIWHVHSVIAYSTKDRVILLPKSDSTIQAAQVSSSKFDVRAPFMRDIIKNYLETWVVDYSSRIRNPLNGDIAMKVHPIAFLFFRKDYQMALQHSEMENRTIPRFMAGDGREFSVRVINTHVTQLQQTAPGMIAEGAADIIYERDFYDDPLHVSGKDQVHVTVHFQIDPDVLAAMEKHNPQQAEVLKLYNPLCIMIYSVSSDADQPKGIE
jgi:hypothetical protein